MTLVRTAAALMAATFALGALAAGNTTNEDFRDSKKMLERKVYFDHRVTLYCGYAFDKQKNVSLPAGFVAPQHKERAGRVEWERRARRELRPRLQGVARRGRSLHE